MSSPEPAREPVLTVLPPEAALRAARPLPPHPATESDSPTAEEWERLWDALRSET